MDEVQYAPGLLRHLKRRVDERREAAGRFILAGSQVFPLMAGVSESLAGRVAVLTLGGLIDSLSRGLWPETIRQVPRTFPWPLARASMGRTEERPP